MSLDDTFQNLASFLNSLDAEGEQKFELSHSLVIICPDCGKNIAFRGRCPKCGGNSWIPAGHAGGIFERMKAQRWRTMISDDDDTGTFRADEFQQSAGAADAPDVPPPSMMESGPADAAMYHDENAEPTERPLTDDDPAQDTGSGPDVTTGAQQKRRRSKKPQT